MISILIKSNKQKSLPLIIMCTLNYLINKHASLPFLEFFSIIKINPCSSVSWNHFTIQLFWRNLNICANSARSKTWSRKTISWTEKFVDKAQQCFAFLPIKPKFKFAVEWSWFLETSLIWVNFARCHVFKKKLVPKVDKNIKFLATK